MIDRRRIYQRFRGMLPPQVRARLWQYKVALGNRRIRALGRHIAAQMDAAEQRDLEVWDALRTRPEWERFRDERIEALRRSLGAFPRPAEELKPCVTRTLEVTGFESTISCSRAARACS